MTFFSIVTPVYNRVDCISRCIESVISQGYENVEHVIVNDGSTDSTFREVLRYSETDRRVTPVDLEQNRGVGFALNRGIEAANGDFIILLGSDDFLLPRALSTINDDVDKFPGFLHYLFVPDDVKKAIAQNPFLNVPQRTILYRDWLEGSAKGDFVHVVARSCFAELKFPEDFRTYEVLNMMRIYRANGKQLFVNKIVVGRERNRKDSVTREYRLDNISTMENDYRFTQRFVDWFQADYARLGVGGLERYLHRGVLIGIALRRYADNRLLLSYLPPYNIDTVLLTIANNLHLGPFVYAGVIAKSKTNRLIEYLGRYLRK